MMFICQTFAKCLATNYVPKERGRRICANNIDIDQTVPLKEQTDHGLHFCHFATAGRLRWN